MTSGFAAIALAFVPAAAAADPNDSMNCNQSDDSLTSQQQDQNAQEVDTFQWSAASGPKLGITVTGLTPDLRAFYGAPSDRGVIIAHVEPRSPAARAGLHVGDILLAVRGESISGADDVLEALSNLSSGEAFELSVVRDRRTITLRAALPQSNKPATQNSENC